MHVILGLAAVLVSVYTLAWAWTLSKKKNVAGVIWAILLAVSASATVLGYLFHHGHVP